MSLRFIKYAIDSLQRSYGTNNILLTRYIVGNVDFTIAKPTNTSESITIRAIPLPKTLNVAFLPKSSVFTIDKKGREFITNDPKCTSLWMKEGNYLTYLGERYNIKSSELIEGYYYFVRATAIGDETGDT